MGGKAVMIEQPNPTGPCAELLTPKLAPIAQDRGFFIGSLLTPGYDTLMQPVDEAATVPIASSYNTDYEDYVQMPKVLLGARGAKQLLRIHESLKAETSPIYLDAAGSAAIEVALIRHSDPEKKRLDLLQSGIECWKKSIARQQALNESGIEGLIDYAQPYRTALNIACMPLVEGLIQGSIDLKICKQVFEDCLSIAQSNLVRIALMAQAGKTKGIAEHIGLGYEANALLAFNRRLSGTWFVIPSLGRSDTGYFFPEQTHDLLVVQQVRGQITSMTPVEIKAAASAKDRARYKALLVRGKMHLSVTGKFTPEHTLKAITDCYEQQEPTEDAESLANEITDRFTDMVRDYYAGERLGTVAMRRSHTVFRDNSIVADRHPGLKVPA